MARRSFGFIRKLPSKKYQASYVGVHGARIYAPFTFLTRGDASAWLASEETKISKGEWQDPAIFPNERTYKFEEYVERHISLQTNSDGSLLRESTKNLYKRLLRVNLAQFHGRTLDSITTGDVSEWWVRSISNGKKTTASKAYKLLSSALKRAVAEKLINSNPCKVKGAQSAITGKRVEIPTQEEVALIAKHINPRYSKMVMLLAFGGFRFGEVTELRRKDVKPTTIDGKQAYKFTIERAVTLVGTETGAGFHRVDKPKSSASVREVAVTSMLTPLIEEILRDIPLDPDSLLFPSASNRTSHLRHDVFMNSWRPALRKAGIEGKYSPHCLRHFAGSHLHLAGANIPELKEWLGDKSTSAVMRYVHSTGRTASLADRMGAMLAM